MVSHAGGHSSYWVPVIMTWNWLKQSPERVKRSSVVSGKCRYTHCEMPRPKVKLFTLEETTAKPPATILTSKPPFALCFLSFGLNNGIFATARRLAGDNDSVSRTFRR